MEHRAVIVAGFGYRGGATPAGLRAALALAQAGHVPVAALAAPDDKAALLVPLAEEMGLPLIALPAAALQAVSPLTRSAASLAARGLGSVAEAAALAGAGAGARLIAPRVIAPDRTATCAIAQGSGS